MSDAIPDWKRDSLYQIETDSTRRKFLSVLSSAGVGLAGMRKATERVFGEKPDGVPLVWRYDRYGNPETIRYLPKERHRRIKVYENLSPNTIYERTEGVNGITLEQQSEDPSDLVLKVYVDDNKPSVQRDLPNQIQSVPLIIEEREVNRRLTEACDRRISDFYDPLPANPEILGTDGNGNTKSDGGTLGIVCWNDNPDDAYKCYITAAHVITFDDGTTAEYIKHIGSYDGSTRDENVGSYVTHSSQGQYGMDIAKYRHRDGTVTPDIRGNADDHLGTLMGSWTHSGLTDRTSGSKSLPVEFAGRSTCYATLDCVDTSKTDYVEYQADYLSGGIEPGDSGGPYLDNDDFLVGLCSHGGRNVNDSHGPTAQELLDRLNAVLTDPRITT